MASRHRGRIIAFQLLYAWDMNREDGSIDAGWADENTATETLSFARLLAAGTMESIDTVDDAIKGQLEHWDFSRLSRVDLALLRISVYALLFRREIPAKVTIDEAVEIAKEYGSEESYRFINGVLDAIRKRNECE